MGLNTTPSPWEVRDGFIYGADGDIVAEGYGYVGDDNLIAAAPELLEALQSIQQSLAKYIEVANNIGVEATADGFYLGHAIDVEEKARQAIAKALGQQ